MHITTAPSNDTAVAPAPVDGIVSSSSRLMIEVLDDVIPIRMFEEAAKSLAAQPLIYGAKAGAIDAHGHWSTQFVHGGADNTADVSPALCANDELAAVADLWAFLEEIYFPGNILIRCYKNGYTFGTEGYFHQDSQRPDEKTAILYLNETWNPDWGGETVFLDAQKEIIRSILPRSNRMVVFDSRLWHCARGVSRACPDLRQTLVLKMRARRDEQFEGISRFLCEHDAHMVPHSRGSLHDHLMRCYALLSAWGEPIEVCTAGALHSIYGTNVFKQAVISRANRELLTSRFGEDVERLVFAFSLLKRPECFDQSGITESETIHVESSVNRPLAMYRQTYRDLQIIECANLIDQASLRRHPVLYDFWQQEVGTRRKASVV